MSFPHGWRDVCSICGVKTIPASEWRAMSLEERLQSGARLQQQQGKCRACRTSELHPRKSWRLEELIDEAEHLFGFGCSHHEIAEKLGIKLNSLAKAYDRGRKRGLTDRRVPYERRMAA